MKHRRVCVRPLFFAVVFLSSLVASNVASNASAQRVSTTLESTSSTNAWLDALLARRASVSLDHASLSDAIAAVSSSAGVRIQYQKEELQPYTRPITLQLTNVPLGEILGRILMGTTLHVLPDGPTHLVVQERTGILRIATAQGALMQGVITGTVVNAKTKQPLRGATVTLSGMGKHVVTNEQGVFRISDVASGTQTVSVRFLGYVKASRSVAVEDGQTASVVVALEPSVNALDQIVVTGTVIATTRREIPNAMTVITAKELEERGITRIEQLFHGDVPGLFARNTGSSNALDAVFMFSRGVAKLDPLGLGTNISSPIKTYVDGVELADAQYLAQIDPRSIDRIEILTGPQASTIYGSNAINGVMQIFTKRGSSPRPQLTADLITGSIQNNFSPALTPTHSLNARVSGMEGRWSYNVGGSWDFNGRWTPANQTARVNGFGGGRLQTGTFTVDLTGRRTVTRTSARGNAAQGATAFRTAGVDAYDQYGNAPQFYNFSLDGQTLGATLTYAPMTWWSHEVVVGTDGLDNTTLIFTPTYGFPADSNRSFTESRGTRQSARYSTTVQLPLTPQARLTVSLGADEWRFTSSAVQALTPVLTGQLIDPNLAVTRNPAEKNRGAFVQGQLGLREALFLTYGLRAEWNPTYGAEAEPNLAPRYGITYTRDVGSMTGKFRVSYGRSTRPPAMGLKERLPNPATFLEPYFGAVFTQLENPDLGPEFQHGVETGFDLDFGIRGSLSLTHYNQTVENLITGITVDSAYALPEWRPVFGDYALPIQQNLNVGRIRNQGWELQSSINTGALTTRGTYSWTKSRFLDINERYRALLDPTIYQPGASFKFLPEHTWAINTTYARARTSVTFAVTGTGARYLTYAELQTTTGRRLLTDRSRIDIPSNYGAQVRGYLLSDVNVVHRVSSVVEGLLQIHNLGNRYENDYDPRSATMGRRTTVGVRIRR